MKQALPPHFPFEARRGSKGRGLAYEDKVGYFLSRFALETGAVLYSHPWLALPSSYEDEPEQICQPDFVLEFTSGACLVVEAKLTQVDCSAQLAKYCRALAPARVATVQICRRLITPPTIRCLEDVTDNDVLLWWR